MSIIKLKNVSKYYYNKTSISSGFSKISLDIDMGEFVVITGESGSGKSTLLNVISGLDSYEEGEMYINGEETSHYTEIDYENYRRKYIGNIFQNFNLVNSYTVYQNIELVLLLNGYKKKEIKEKILNIIKTVGLTKYKNTKASKLSGGQKQRVAIARALAKDTPIIVADEPTGNLDVKSAKSIMKLLKDISKKKLVVIVTHNYEQVEEYATRKISMNDGHIIEDKKLVPYEKAEPDLVDYKDLTNFNKLRISFRNAFNIKTKFALLFLVYFFLTFLVFSEYSSLSKMTFDEGLNGFNDFFGDISPERVILNKKDKTFFTKEEIDNIKKLDNIDKVEENDLILDFNTSLYNEDTYFYGNIKNINEIDKVDFGTVAQNDDEVVVSVPDNSYYINEENANKFIGKYYTLQNNHTGEDMGKVKLVGINIIESNSLFSYNNSIIYISNKLIDNFKISSMNRYSFTKLEIEDKIIDSNNSFFRINRNDKVKNGEAFVYNELNMYCSYYNCQNKKITLDINNIYYDNSKQLTIKHILNKDNFKNLTGLNEYNDYQNTIFISNDDYEKLYAKGNYQISIFLNSIKDSDNTVSKLNSLGYNTFLIKDSLANPQAQLIGIIRIFRNVVFIIATVALFFISYFIIRIILKSRNIYFSTIRILGATKKVSKQLLNLELYIDMNIAYITFLILVGLTKTGIITNKYILDLITYFTLKDYILIYLILLIMSLLISNRFAQKLFKDSVMKTYREEV